MGRAVADAHHPPDAKLVNQAHYMKFAMPRTAEASPILLDAAAYTDHQNTDDFFEKVS